MKAIIFAAALLLMSSAAILAQPGPDTGAWKKMNLTEEQKSTLKSIRSETQKQMIDIRASLQKKRIDMKEMVDGESGDRAAFERLSREIADLQVQQKMLLFDTDQKVMKNLNPEQQKMWKEMKAKRMHKAMRRGRGPGQQMRGPGEMMDESPEMMHRRYPAPPPEDD